MRRRAKAALLAALLCAGCGGAGSVADRFVDRYYVESDQAAALELSSGVAALKLREEQRLLGAVRRGVPPTGEQARVYYQRTGITESASGASADYRLEIRPQGGGQIERRVHLELERQGGAFRVVRFGEQGP